MITRGMQRDMVDLRAAVSRGPSALADILVINDKNCSLPIALTAMDQKLQKS